LIRSVVSRRLRWDPVWVLRELRGRDGGPHVGTRLVALVLALMLAFPLTVFLWRGIAWLLGPAF